MPVRGPAARVVGSGCVDPADTDCSTDHVRGRRCHGRGPCRERQGAHVAQHRAVAAGARRGFAVRIFLAGGPVLLATRRPRPGAGSYEEDGEEQETAGQRPELLTHSATRLRGTGETQRATRNAGGVGAQLTGTRGHKGDREDVPKKCRSEA